MQKKIFLSSEQLSTLLLGHKQLLASVTEGKFAKCFLETNSKRQGKTVAALCLQKFAALVKGNLGH